MQITENLIFYPERGLFCLTDGKESCIAGTGGYVTPLFVAALSGQLADKYQQLLKITLKFYPFVYNLTIITNY